MDRSEGSSAGGAQGREAASETAKCPTQSSKAAGDLLLNAARSGVLMPQQRQALASKDSNLVEARDPDGRTALHFAAGYGNEEVVDALLAADAPPAAVDAHGDTPLHLAAAHGHPMAAYALSKAVVGAVKLTNSRGQTPVDVAALCQHHEVLNAMLLGCAGETGPEAVEALKAALAGGAVPDTWAPNGSSALMLAAAADSGPGCEALLDGAATLELADALGRTALMFAAGNNACRALAVLLAAGASVAARDRRGRCVSDYARPESQAHEALSMHLATLQKASDAMQAKLLESLEEEEEGCSKKKGGAAAAGKAAKKAAKKKRRVQALPASVPETEAVSSGGAANGAAAVDNPGRQAGDEASGPHAAVQAAAGSEPTVDAAAPQQDAAAAAASADGQPQADAPAVEPATTGAPSDTDVIAASQPQPLPPSKPPDAGQPSGAAVSEEHQTAEAAASGTKCKDAWIQPPQPQEEWHTVGAKTHARRGRHKERSASQERPRTPSCASACSNMSRDIDALPGRRQSSALSLLQLQLTRRRGIQNSRLGSDDGVSLDGSERSSAVSCSSAAPASSGRTSALPASTVASASTVQRSVHDGAAGASATADSLSAPAAELLTWAHRVAGIKASPAAGQVVAVPTAALSDDAAVDAVRSAAHAAEGSTAQDQPLPPAAALSPCSAVHGLDAPHHHQHLQQRDDQSFKAQQSAWPQLQDHQQQQLLSEPAFGSKQAVAPLRQPGFSSPLEPGTPPQREGASPAPGSPSSRTGPCPRCAAARAEAAAALCGAAAMHERMSALEQQVKELMAAAASAERAHRTQLDALLQDAATHEAAAVAAALSVVNATENGSTSTAARPQPTGDGMQSGTRPQVVRTLQPNGKTALAILNSGLQQQSQLTPEQLILLQHPGTQAAASSRQVERASLSASRLSQPAASAPFSLFGGGSTGFAAPTSMAPHALLYDAAPITTADALHSSGTVSGGGGLSAANLLPSGGLGDASASATELTSKTSGFGGGLSGSQLLHGFGGVIGGRDACYGFQLPTSTASSHTASDQPGSPLAMSSIASAHRFASSGTLLADIPARGALSQLSRQSLMAAPGLTPRGDSPTPKTSSAVGSSLRPIGTRPVKTGLGNLGSAVAADDAVSEWHPMGRQAWMSAAGRSSLGWSLMGGALGEYDAVVLPGSA